MVYNMAYKPLFLAHGHSSSLLNKFSQVVNLLFQSLNCLLSLVLLAMSLVHHAPSLLNLLLTINDHFHPSVITVVVSSDNSNVKFTCVSDNNYST